MNIVKVYHFPVQNTYTGKLLFSSMKYARNMVNLSDSSSL